MKISQVVGPRTSEIIEAADPVPGAAQILVEVVACGVCTSDIGPWLLVFLALVAAVSGVAPGSVAMAAEAGSAIRRTSSGLVAACAPRRLPVIAIAEPGPEFEGLGYDLTLASPVHPSQAALRLDALVRTAVAEEEFELRQETFADRGPRDKQGRGLRDFDLKTRLFRYPLSYMTYSAAFDALPDRARNQIYQRLNDVLSGKDQSPKHRSIKILA